MEYLDAVQKQALEYHRTYEYKCVICQTKRTTTKVTVAKRRVCTSCVRARVESEWDKRQQKLFI